MRCKEKLRSLICYAGSATEASIGSKPMGSELRMLICTLIVKSQHLIDGRAVKIAGGKAQISEIFIQFFTFRNKPCLMGSAP